MPVSASTFEQLALEDDLVRWELVCGRLREKPGGTVEHNSTMSRIVRFVHELQDNGFHIRSNAGYVRRGDHTYLCPDAMIIPSEYAEKLRGTMKLESYGDPLPFVAEVWSKSTGNYDVDTKFPEYKQRGDLEIWRLHPYEKTLIAWRRQPDGTYSESHYAGGSVPVESLPGVSIRLEELFR